jgi:type IV pilus assembly protein PilC
MPRYFYKAKSLKGEDKSGFLEAKDTHQLSQKLHAQGFILIKAESEEKTKKKKFELSFFSYGIPITEKMFFIRNLQVMIAAGLPLPRAIKILSRQAKNKKFRSALLDVQQKLMQGKSLSESLGYYPNIFSNLFKSMVEVGEESGTLEKVLHTLAVQMEKEYSLRSKVKSAAIYPIVIICAMIGVGILMLIMVIPKLAETFEEFNLELPIATKIVIGLGMFLSRNWHLVFIGIIFLIIILRQFLKVGMIKRAMDAASLRLPIISPIIKATNSAYTARTLSSLIAAGTPLPKALEITSGTLGNFYFKEAMNEAAKKVRKGSKLSEVLATYKNVYPLIIIQMMSVGEETGETSNVLSELARFFEEEVSNATKNLASVIEPILMIIIGITIGFFAVSMIQPMYSMLGAI